MNEQNEVNSDHELLQYAAKAAGYKQYYSHWLGRDSFVTYEEEVYSEIKKRRVVAEKTMDWNPLTDDGDAFRLAVKCLPFYTLRYSREDWEKCGEDGYAATRRAIVRAAAEIGRNMV